MMKIIIAIVCLSLAAGCTSREEQSQRFTLIWRETSATPIEELPTPKGFKISPAEAVKPVMSRRHRAPWAEFYLFVDAGNYCFGNTRKGTDLIVPEPGCWVINGATRRCWQPAYNAAGSAAGRRSGKPFDMLRRAGSKLDELRKN